MKHIYELLSPPYSHSLIVMEHLISLKGVMGFHLKLCVHIAVCQELISLNQHFTMILMFN